MDVVKFVAIFLVCAGHVTKTGTPLDFWIYSFHMPLFMLLCGFFSTSSYKLPFRVFLKKKAKSLLLPAISFSILDIIITRLLYGGNFLDIFLSKMIGGMWFLKTVFFCYCIVYFIKKTGFSDWLSCIISCMLMIVVPKGNFLQTNFLLLFFWAGYFLKVYEQYYYKHCRTVTLLAGGGYVLFHHSAYPELINIFTIISSPLPNLSLLCSQYFTALSMAIFIIGVVYLFSKLKNIRVIMKWPAHVGKYTLGIYGMQTILLERLFVFCNNKFSLFQTDNIFSILIISVITIIMSMFFIQLLKQIRIANYFLFGGQY